MSMILGNLFITCPTSYRVGYRLVLRFEAASDVHEKSLRKAYAKIHYSTLKGQSTRKQDVFEYFGPFSVALKRVKILSLTSCTLACLMSPVILSLPNAVPSLAGRIGMAATLTLFGCFTTGLLHWYSSPYIHRLQYEYSTRQFEAVTLNLLAKEKINKFGLDDIKPPNTLRPMSTFQAKGNLYYIDSSNFYSKDLLEEITKRS